MKLSKVFGILSAVTFGVPVLVGTAYAGDSLKVSIIEAPAVGNPEPVPVNTSDFHLAKSGKLSIAPSKNLGESIVAKLGLKGIDCVAEGNDGDKPYKCGVAGAPVGAVLDMSVHQFMTPSLGIDMMHVAGIPLLIEKGKAVFQATGKGAVTGPDVFAALISQTLGKPMGYHVVVVRTEGTVPSDCDTAPPGPHCLDGIEFAFTGFMNGN